MPIFFDGKTKTFFLDGKNVTYAFFINDCGYAEHLYYGKTIGHDDLAFMRTVGATSCLATTPGKDTCDSYHHFPAELSFFGTGDYREPTVELTDPDGSCLTELLYDGYEILASKPKINGMPSMKGGETLVLHLSDKVNGFGCDLYYTVYDDSSVIARRAVYKSGGKDEITLNRAYSFCFSLPQRDLDVISLWGAWAKERNIERTPLHHGVFSIDSKRATSSATLNPFLAIVDKDTGEDTGNAYGFSLVYSSSFALKVEKSSSGKAFVSGGINDFGFRWNLGSGESLETPEVVIAYSDKGLGGMSRAFHDAFRNHLINERFVRKPRPIVINNWEGTYFDFDNEKLCDIASAVAGTGIDTFVLDDGWFGKRDDDISGLGDWFVNEKKLKGGLGKIIDHVHSLGMNFGLWFEPEMISGDSELFRAHPDYAIKAPGRPGCYSRHQYMLDLTRADVRDYIVESVCRILRDNKIEYVKWDYNRNVTEFYSLGLEPKRQGEFSHRYALGLYELCERIVEANPSVFFEGCAGGGARFDPAMLRYFSQIWTSDDTDAEERTRIQYGTSLVYPLSAMSCHVSVIPNHQTARVTPEKTRADIAHLGATGYELDTSSFTEADKERTAREVEEYKAMQGLVLDGDLYRTEDPFTSNYFGFMAVSRDKTEALLTVYRRMGSVNNEPKYFKVKGLDESKYYLVTGIDTPLKGSTLMNIGLPERMPSGDYITETYRFTAVK